MKQVFGNAVSLSFSLGWKSTAFPFARRLESLKCHGMAAQQFRRR
jgi:hypothetical protein